MHKNTYLFALSAAASAAVAASPGVAKAVCGCTLQDIKASVIRTQGPDSFVYLGSPSAGYDAQIEQDTMYGFGSHTGTPQAWFDYDLLAAGTVTTTATLCRLSYTGSAVVCAPAGSQTATSPGFLHKEMSVPVTGTFGSSVASWDLIKVHVVGPTSAFSPRGVPVIEPACW